MKVLAVGEGMYPMYPSGVILVKTVPGNSTSQLLSPAWTCVGCGRPCYDSDVACAVRKCLPLAQVTTRLHLLLRGRIPLPAKVKLLKRLISDTSVLDCKLASL